MNIFAKMASVLALSILLVTVNACKAKKPAVSPSKPVETAEAAVPVAEPSATPLAPKEPAPEEPPKEYRSEPIAIGMEATIKDIGFLLVDGTALKDSVLPDGVRVLVHLETTISGVTLESNYVAGVKDGGFVCTPTSNFDGSRQFPAGEYYLRATVDPSKQTTAIQAVLGERGANLTGPQVKTDEQGNKTVVFDQHFLKLKSPEAEAQAQAITNEFEKRRTTVQCLYRAVQTIRKDAAFWERGVGSLGKEWSLLIDMLKKRDWSLDGIYGKRIAERLESLAKSYQESKGMENEHTTDELRSFIRELRTLSPNLEGMWVGRSVAQFLDKLNKGQVPIDSVIGGFVSVGGSEVFTVSSTSPEFVFYTTSMSGSPIEIAIERMPGIVYRNGTRLKGRTLQVVGAAQFAGGDVVIMKPLPQ